MAKRRSDADGVVRQLRPDDSGWLAELRRARTEKIDLSGEAEEERSRWADEPTLNGGAPRDADPQIDVSGSGDHRSPWAPPPGDESSEPPVPVSPPLPDLPLSAPPVSPRPIPIPPVSPVPIPMPPVSPAPLAGRPLWTMAVPDPPQWSLPLPDRPLSPPPMAVREAAAVRFPQPPPPARWLPDPVPEALQLAHRTIEHYHDITPGPYDEPSGVPRSLRREDRPRREVRKAGRPRLAILLPLGALAAGAIIGLAYKTTDRTEPPTTAPTEAPLEILATSITDRGSSVTLSWTDPTGGEALFVISEITPDGARPVREVPAGQTETVIVGLDPAAAQYCFRVLAVRGGETAASATTCTPTRAVAG